jgi:serine/threonine protein kinase
MSLLYLGLHPITRQVIVVKVLSPEFVTHPEATQRFLKEARIITLADHPNIVKLYGEGEWEGGLYIAMEMIHGISLRQFIAQQSLSLKRTIDILLQVSYALLHLHTHGVIHRDLKPENILIAENGTVKVIDFGIAQLHEEPASKPAPLQLMGTPSYMSPEQKDNPHNVTIASDIYSLGIITYELILGRLSYGLIDLSLLPKGLRKIVEKMLAVSVKERYQDIVDLIGDLSQYLKSADLEKDRPGSDQVKELLETLQKAGQSLSPLTPPDWPIAEIGIAKLKSPGQLGLYYDFFKLPNTTYLVLIAECSSIGIDAPVFLGAFRGMIHTLLHHTRDFHPISFFEALNHLLYEDTWKQSYKLNLLHLDPLQNQLSYASSDLGGLFHVPAGTQQTRKLSSENPLLGISPAPKFSETTDNWRVGDTLVLHSVDPLYDPELTQALQENLLLSAPRQAEALLRKLPAQKLPSTLISLRRLT